jgi:hypothetical protein
MLLELVRFGNDNGLEVILHPRSLIRLTHLLYPTVLVDLGLGPQKGLDPRENTVTR